MRLCLCRCDEAGTCDPHRCASSRLREPHRRLATACITSPKNPGQPEPTRAPTLVSKAGWEASIQNNSGPAPRTWHRVGGRLRVRRTDG